MFSFSLVWGWPAVDERQAVGNPQHRCLVALVESHAVQTSQVTHPSYSCDNLESLLKALTCKDPGLPNKRQNAIDEAT